MTGWGLAESSITCYISQCQVAPYFTGANGLPPTALAGKETEEDDYNYQINNSNTLLSVEQWTWTANCKPGGFGVSGGGPPNNPGDQYLISQLDQNNPVVVCDPRITQEDDYTLDGVTTNLSDPRVVHKTTSYSYDTNNKSGISGYDYGNLSEMDESDNYPSPSQIVTTQTYYPNDNVGSGIYLTSLPAITQTQDGSNTPYACSQSVYGNNSNATTPPSLPDVTQAQSYSIAGSGGCTGTNNLITVQHTYDASGNAVTAIDGDGHLGCTENGNQYSACAMYDSADTHILTATNALNQATTYTYATDSTGGFGEWLTAETDPNTQTTQYQYDVLGRLTAIARPGDSLGSPTVSYTYTNTCTQG
jgi:YD repeat-containing protein